MKRTQLSLFSREFFQQTGKQGGKKRARELSAAQRSASARKAAKARWSKAKRKPKA